MLCDKDGCGDARGLEQSADDALFFSLSASLAYAERRFGRPAGW